MTWVTLYRNLRLNTEAAFLMIQFRSPSDAPITPMIWMLVMIFSFVMPHCAYGAGSFQGQWQSSITSKETREGGKVLLQLLPKG
jgi:hypothetical protein